MHSVVCGDCLDHRDSGEGAVRTVRWLINEYRHEDAAGRYYMDKVMTIYFAGLKLGLALGLIPVLLWWILR